MPPLRPTPPRIEIEDYGDVAEYDGEEEPTCDICNATMAASFPDDWNGETGNHRSCEGDRNGRSIIDRIRRREDQLRRERDAYEYIARNGMDVPSRQEVEPSPMPRPTYTDEIELVRCAYVERQCLRRDRDGMVPARDENGRSLTITCETCEQTFCVQHRHTEQRRPENYCDAHGVFHPRCVMATRCDECNHQFCDETEHVAGSSECMNWLDQTTDDVDFDRGYGGYNGPWREAELLFEGDEPVPGLAEGKRYIAFELEEELRSGASGQFTLPRKFGITTDGSLRDNGIEVTFPPSRMDALVENVRTAVTALQRGGYHPTARCGMHTHIDLRDKKDDNVFLSRLFATFYAVEDVLFAMQGRDRAANNYCRPLRNGWKFYDAYGVNAPDFDFVFYKTPKSLANKLRLEEMKAHKGGNRYNAFNFLSVWYRGSLEVRLHEGCLNARQMLMWAELLQKIVQRVEDGITYPVLRKLLDMPVGPDKLALFAKVFRLPDPMLRHIQERITTANGDRWPRYRLPYDLGTPKKGRPKSILPRRTFRATHRRCRWCSAVVALERRCSYCRREPQFTRDAHGLRDERVMRLRGGGERDYTGRIVPTVLTEAEFQRISGQVAAPAGR